MITTVTDYMKILTHQFLRRLSVLLLLVATPAIVAQAQSPRHEIVRGRVTSDSGRVVSNATVLIAATGSREFQSAVTDANGLFSTDWPNGAGDYDVAVKAAGFTAATQHAKRSGADSVLALDFRLVRVGAPEQLSTVVTTAQRPQPPRNTALEQDVAASEFGAVPQNAARRLGPDLAGDLNAIAGMAPGVMQVPGGISVFGLGGAQNSTTLNGMAFGAADVPRDAATRVRVTSSSYDPAIGWFSGARTQVDLVPGELFTSRQAHLTVDAPQAQWTDPVSAHLGQRYANFNGSLGGSGQLVDDRWAYNYGIQGGRKSGDIATLLNADPSLLRHAGVSSDSVARLLHLLQAAQIPPGGPGVATGLLDENISFIGRIDHLPFDWTTMRPATTTWGVTAYAKMARSSGQSLAPTATASHGAETSQRLASIQGEWSTYLRREFLTDFRSSVSYARNATDPAVRLPDGRVLVASTFDDGSGGVANLLFGGNPVHTSSRVWTWENIADFQLYPAGKATHKVRLTGDIRLDASSQDVASNDLGTFTFNSLADLEANRPSSFSRTLNAPLRDGSAWNAFLAVGDVWRASSNLVFKYGLRAEGNVFASTPANNPAVFDVFGVRTDHAPNSSHPSPRFGAQYNVPGDHGRPRGTLRIGVGEFRNLIDPSLLASPSVFTGLSNGTAQIACSGSAPPLPDWAAYGASLATVPRGCGDGSLQSFIDSASTVRVLDPSYSAARSWRGNVGWSSSLLQMPFSIDLTASHNISQHGSRELNFTGIQRFTTAEEGRRMFVTPSSIFAATGTVSPVDSRRTTAFGRVTEGVSDLRSESRQASFSVRPNLGSKLAPYLGDFIVAYTLASVRDQLRGFDLATFGDPSTRDWARGALDARHQLSLQGVIRPHPGWYLFFYGHFQSGTPYTPLVRTDVNGDGLANDRAFVFNPANTADPAVASGMKALLSSTSPQARDCLMRQLGQPAARASCVTPWSATLNTSLRISGAQLWHSDRADLVINIGNPLGGLDQLLHGSNHLHGWGTTPSPDPVLLDARGFDPTASKFKYAVNPRFGTTSSASNILRAPFRLTVDVSVDLSPPQTLQQLDRWLRPGRKGRSGTKVPESDLRRRFQRTVPDPYADVMQEADSLLLTATQVSALQAADDRYRAHVDSMWETLGQQLASLPDNYDAGSAFSYADGVTDDVWEFTRLAVQRDFRQNLTPDQLTMLTGLPRTLFNARDKVHIRIFPRGS